MRNPASSKTCRPSCENRPKFSLVINTVGCITVPSVFFYARAVRNQLCPRRSVKKSIAFCARSVNGGRSLSQNFFRSTSVFSVHFPA